MGTSPRKHSGSNPKAEPWWPWWPLQASPGAHRLCLWPCALCNKLEDPFAIFLESDILVRACTLQGENVPITAAPGFFCLPFLVLISSSLPNGSLPCTTQHRPGWGGEGGHWEPPYSSISRTEASTKATSRLGCPSEKHPELDRPVLTLEFTASENNRRSRMQTTNGVSLRQRLWRTALPVQGQGWGGFSNE